MYTSVVEGGTGTSPLGRGDVLGGRMGIPGIGVEGSVSHPLISRLFNTSTVSLFVVVAVHAINGVCDGPTARQLYAGPKIFAPAQNHVCMCVCTVLKLCAWSLSH